MSRALLTSAVLRTCADGETPFMKQIMTRRMMRTDDSIAFQAMPARVMGFALNLPKEP